MTRRAHLALLAAALGLPLGAHGQSRAEYRPAADTLRYIAENTYVLYFVSEGDSVGDPVPTRAVELHHFAAGRDGLTVWVRLEVDEPEPFRAEAAYAITPGGRVVAIDGRPVAQVPTARVGLLPHLADPPASLRAGRQWTDTVLHEYQASYGRDQFAVQRRYRVHRMIDTLGTRVAHIVGQGSMQLRHGGWQDSTEGTVWWQDVAGAVVDTVWFDVTRGQLVADVTILDLIGTGGAGPKGRGVTVPSGLRSETRRRRTLSR